MLYKHPIIDDFPVKIKILQLHQKRGRVEITRDLNGNAGFWVNIEELIEEPDYSSFTEWVKEDDNLWNKY